MPSDWKSRRIVPAHITDQLLQTFDLTNDDLYQVDGPINFLRLMPVISEVDRPDLKFRPFVPAIVTGSSDHDDIFLRSGGSRFWCIIPTKASRRCSTSSSKLPKTRMYWRSSKRSIGPAAIRKLWVTGGGGRERETGNRSD